MQISQRQRWIGPGHCWVLGLVCSFTITGCGESGLTEETSEPRALATIQRSTAESSSVTLITGDRVTLRGGAALVTPAPNRAQVPMLITRDGDHVIVLPRDMVPLLAAGQLDRALFDVTQLLAEGYGDDERDDVPLIITGASDAPGFARGLAPSVTVGHTLPTLHMVTVRQPKRSGGAALAAVRGFAAASAGTPAPKIWLDRVRKPLLDHSVAQIGGPAAHARGFTGTGVAVAVLDTGVDSSHADLAGKVIAAEDFTGDGEGALDVLGHGTHVASIIAGTGAASGGQFAGVAPNAQLISGRVCDAGRHCFDSAILAGIEWAAAEQHARIINLSLGFPDFPELDPIEQAVNDLSARLGTLFVVAAGNDGGDETVSSPASADAALAVGAVDRDDQLAVFSSRGPRRGDGAIKPDLTAPGVEIVAARATGVEPIGTPVGTSYTALSGTSMATPHVAGAAALLLQQHPAWTGAELKSQLMGSANPNPALGPFGQGAGRVDIDRGTRQDVSAEPTALDLGTVAFPHDDDPPLVRTVRYRNGGGAPITLTLTATLTGPAGPGLISVAPAALVVPAGGTADAVVTTHTDGDLANGRYTGALVASAGDVRVETPIALEREPELFDLTLEAVDGEADVFSFTGLLPADGDAGPAFFFFGRITVRLPRGQYQIDGSVFSDRIAFIANPRFQLDHDATVRLDAALALPIDVDVGNPDVHPTAAAAMYADHVTGHGGAAFTFGSTLYLAQLGDPLPPDELFSGVFLQLGDDPSFQSKTLYNLAHSERGHLPAGWRETIAPSQLATVDVHHAGRADALYVKHTRPWFDDGAFGLQSTFATVPDGYEGPFARTELYFGDGVLFESFVVDAREGSEGQVIAATTTQLRRYRAGQHVSEPWNVAPGGPAFGTLPQLVHGVTQARSTALRVDDQLRLTPTIVGDTSAQRHDVASILDHARLALSRNGTQIFESIDGALSAVVDVPPEPASYRFELEADRAADLFTRSTHVRAAWTFRSAHVDGDRSLPLLTMRYLPELDDDGATAARVLVLPIAFDRPFGAGTPFVVQARLEASFDDGAHWSRVPLAAFGDRGLAVIVHPRGAHHVSLRSSATDLAGNAVEQTILRAYGVR